MLFDWARYTQRRWLAAYGLLERPWFILGSAPSPTIPDDILDRAALICVNNAWRTAESLGLPLPPLTISSRHKDWTPDDFAQLPLLLWVNSEKRKDHFRRQVKAYFAGTLQRRKIRRIDRELRSRIQKGFLGDELLEIGDKHKPSTGVVAALYALYIGVPEIILAGISVEVDGYSFGDLPGIQLHRAEDQYTIRKMARCCRNVSTTEPALARATGLPLFRAP